MWFEFRKVDMDFMETAPLKYVVECEVGMPRAQVWGAFVNPATWKEWFPGVDSASYPDQSEPYGVGTRRTATVHGRKFEEYIIAWDEGNRWAYYIARASFPLARAQLECTEFEERGSGTLVRWTLAADPRFLMRLSAPIMQRVLDRLLKRALRNLESYLRR